jgi:hypothetical protein
MMRSEKYFIILAAVAVALVMLVGAVPNVSAVSAADNKVIHVTVEFDDDTDNEFIDTENITLTDNQTAVTSFDVYAGQFNAYNGTTPLSYVAMRLTEPGGSHEDYNLDSFYKIGGGVSGYNSTDLGHYYYDLEYEFDKDGAYTFTFIQYLYQSGSWVICPTFTITIYHNVNYTDPVELGMGDWAFFELTLGFIGVIGFIATPMVTAKLMATKDPITLMSAFLICMIMFGTFVYVFLLGGS